MHEVLVNRLGGLSLPRKSVVRLTDCPDMTLDVYPGRTTTMQQMKQEYWKGNQHKNISFYVLNISFIQHNAGLQLVDFFHQWEARNILIYRDIMLIYRDL